MANPQALIDPGSLLDPWCTALLSETLAAQGLDRMALHDPARLSHALGAPESKRRLIEALVDLLKAPLQGNASALRGHALERGPSLRSHIQLAEHCIQALPKVLSEQISATDVLFPGGTSSRVESIYKQNPWADYFNRLTAKAARQTVSVLTQRPLPRPIRIIEIGAGTGGTTTFVLEALHALKAEVEYVYTDLSQGFVQLGKDQFGSAGFEMVFSRLDIEADPVNFAASADLVIATNVLHATRNIGATLGNVRSLLKNDGLLLLNELTQSGAFATVTFGLLDGWWCFDDADQRLPHSPILSAKSWQAALSRHGFGPVSTYGWNRQESGFQCLFLASAAPRQERRRNPEPVRRAPKTVAGTSPAQGIDGIAFRMREVLASRLGFTPEVIDWQRPFAELGVDSIVAPQLVEDLQVALGVLLDTTDLYNYGTIRDLSEHVAHRPPSTSDPLPLPQEGYFSPEPSDDIAIIGMASRFSGALDPDALWTLIREGMDSTGPVSGARWGATELALNAGLLPEADAFDPDFFRIAHAEAEVMDPQQRVFLEECWHALENAGVGPQRIEPLSCGVFVGVAAQNHPANQGDSRAALGNSNAILAARIAYHLNLKGPAIALDTACSSSLVAIHLAAESIRAGDCDLALAGGVSVLLCTPALPRFLIDAGMVSPSGQCRAFDAEADGFVPGEGVGVVVLTRLDQALASGDRILGIIRGSGINQDGRTSGITAPSGPAQTALIQRVCSKAKIHPSEIHYVEAHGTGTPLGDPIELTALTEALGERHPEQRIPVGSIKTNVGHTLTAAGVAGVIKVLLALRAREIPPSLHFATPNPRLKLEESPFYVPTQVAPWTSVGPRRASVSSFGFSGTNAYLIIEEAPPASPQPLARAPSRPVLLLLSAQNPNALKQIGRRLSLWIQAHPEVTLGDLARTLNAGRFPLPVRKAFWVKALDEFQQCLNALILGGSAPGLIETGHLLSPPSSLHWIQADDDPLALAGHFVAGGAADWHQLGAADDQILSLPGYPFQRDPFPLLGPQQDSHRPLYDILSRDDPAFRHHQWQGRPVLPAAALICLAAQTLPRGPYVLSALSWLKPLSHDKAILEVKADGQMTIQVGPDVYARGSVHLASAGDYPQRPQPEVEVDPASARDLYTAFHQMGFDYGPLFQVVQGIRSWPNRVHAILNWSGPAPASAHPEIGLLDGMIQAAFGLSNGSTPLPSVMPVHLDRAWIDPTALVVPLTVEIIEHTPLQTTSERVLSLSAWNANGQLAAQMERLTICEVATDETSQPLIYRPLWKTRNPTPTPRSEGPGDGFLCFGEWATVSAQRLEQGTIQVLPGPSFRRIGDTYHLPPGDPAALRVLADDLRLRGVLPETIVHLPIPKAVEEAWGPVGSGAGTLMHFLSAWLPLRDPSRPLRVVQIESVDSTDSFDQNPNISASVGLLQSLALEEPRFEGKVIGLDLTRSAPPSLAALCRLGQNDKAVEIVLDSQGSLQVRSYEPVPLQRAQSPLPDHPLCVVTGGAGGLGLTLVSYLWRTFRARTVIFSKSPGTSRQIEQLRQEGATCVLMSVDVADPIAVKEAITGIRRQMGDPDAVFHLAGVQVDGFLRRLSDAELAAVIRPKVNGLMHLMDALEEVPVRDWITFGSLAGAFGAPGQAPYAAANRAMDALLERMARQRPERRVLALDWGYWMQPQGMQAQDRDEASMLASTGLRGFRPEEGIALFDQVLASGLSGRVLLAQGSAQTFEAFVAHTLGAVAPTAASRAAPDAVKTLRYLTQIVSEVTHTPVERLGAEQSLEDFGIDSIMITRLNSRIERDYGAISKTLFFEHSTLRSLAQALSHEGGRQPGDEPIPSEEPVQPSPPNSLAVVGMAARLPMAADVNAYWKNLEAGVLCIEEIPDSRWPLDGFYHPDQTHVGTSYSKWGGFISEVDRFDPLFFKIAPEEAVRMDPQERLFLEVAWQALEDGGFKRSDFGEPGSRRVGVFVGVMYGDYGLVAHDAAQGGPIGGAAPYWSIANRASYVFGFEGPSLAIDTACSSSLTALHLACQALITGDCDAALVGGVNLSLHPDKYIGLSQGRFASTDGRCRSFTEGGDGYVPGEGVIAIFIKRVEDAEALHDQILGLIRATAINHGGRSNGYSVPNPNAHAQVIARALAKARVAPQELGYIEAHGTGTRLGDPIEIEGLGKALGNRSDLAHIPIGSAKAAIGHLEAAAGLAGLVKVLLQMRHERFAAMPRLGAINSDIDLTRSGFKLQDSADAWPPGPHGIRYAGVSSFGAGGANAHAVIASVAKRLPTPDRGESRVIPLSARTEEQVRSMATALATFLKGATPAPSLSDLCHTLTQGRESLRCRCAFWVRDIAELIDTLTRIGKSREPSEVFWGEAADASALPPAEPLASDLKTQVHFWCQGGHALWPHTGRRISLAPRPFLGRRYWVPKQPSFRPVADTVASDWTRTQVASPSSSEVIWRFKVPATASLLTQHRVGGIALLPGAALIAMALELDASDLIEMTWLRPVVARADGVSIEFRIRETDLGKAFTVRSQDQDETLAQGLLGPVLADSAGSQASKVLPSGLGLEKEPLYQRLKALGIEYGTRFQRILRLFPGDTHTWAELDPSDTQHERIDPAWLDAVFQVLAGLVPNWHQLADQGGIPVPYTLASLKITGDLTRAVRVEALRTTPARSSLDRHSLRVLDADGQLLMTIGNLTARKQSEAVPEGVSTLLKPTWIRDSELRPAGKGAKAWIIAAPGAEALARELVLQFEDASLLLDPAGFENLSPEAPRPLYLLDTAAGTPETSPASLNLWAKTARARALALLQTLKSLRPALDAGLIARIVIVTRGIQPIDHDPTASVLSSDAGGLLGLGKVAAREWPQVDFQLLDLPVTPGPLELLCLANEPGDAAAAEMAYRDGYRYVRRLLTMPVTAEDPPSDWIQTGDVCLIIGGMGGIGQTLAESFAREKAARVVLIGRRAPDERSDQFVTRLRQLGGDGLYLKADACNPDDLELAVAQAESRFGSISIILHAALALRDRTLTGMSEAEFEAAFAPRAEAAASLLGVFQHRMLRRILLFSSANVFLGQPGQANYVSGNMAMTLLGQAMRRQGMPVQVIHWGLWGEVGAVSDPAIQKRFQEEGVYPITPDIGVHLFKQAVLADVEIAPVRLDLKVLRSMGLLVTNDAVPSPATSTISPSSTQALLDLIHQQLPLSPDIDADLTLLRQLEQWGLARVAKIFCVLAPEALNRRLTPMRLVRELGVTPAYQALAMTLLNRLSQAGLIEERDGLLRLCALQEPIYPAALVDGESHLPWLKAQRHLLEMCLEGLPDVIRGQKPGMSILFPNGDAQWVEVAYQGNPISDRANLLLATALVEEVSARALAHPHPIRILEVGAGTGGSTLPILAALQPFKDRITYWATDLSPLLTTRLAERCLQADWTIETRVLDIAQPISDLAKGSFDLIVAANVVHATADVHATLSHLHHLIAPSGRMLLNELTAATDMGTLIFGLTPQWWGASDPARRLPDTPALSPEGWMTVLGDAGWQDVGCLGVESNLMDSAQSLLTATRSPDDRVQWQPAKSEAALPSKPTLVPAASAPPMRTAKLPSRVPPASADSTAAIYQSLCRIFGAVLGVDPKDFRGGDTFEHYGVESLSALEIRNRIAVEYPGVSATLLFEYNTLDRLTEYLWREHAKAPTPPQTFIDSVPDVAPADFTRGHAPRPLADEPIAIIGFAGRFPGGETSEAFWKLIHQGESALRPVPVSRWNHQRYLDRSHDKVPAPGRYRSQVAGFLDDIAGFDPLFFGIPPVEAATMDPQERLFLETCWQAIEDAGTTPRRLIKQSEALGTQGSVGVFCGVMNTGYQWLAAEGWHSGHPDAASSHFWSIPNRISYLFDFDGPSLAVDTACSASLTAIHLACNSLRRGECAAALAGGINLITHPRQMVNLSQAGMTSEGLECRAFGADADGFIDGEGVGVVLLKPLAQAQADGDRIDGVITATAINAGGKTSGFTVPNPRAQANVVRSAFAEAGIKADGLCLIETHGTGTRLGDPIELSGLKQALADTPPSRPLPLGTLKANIGHLESAAGVASLIKVLLQLRYQTIAPARHAADPNPLIDWSQMPFRLPKAAEPWPLPADRPRRAAISGFGAGGANAHLIMEQCMAPILHPEPMAPEWIPVSARTPELLKTQATELLEAITGEMTHHLRSNPDAYLANIGRTLREGRVTQVRLKWIRAESLDDLLDGLRSIASGDETNTPVAAPNLEPSSHPHARPLSLPTSLFLRQSYWLDVEPGHPEGPAHSRQSPHPNTPATGPSKASTRLLEMRWRNEIGGSDRQVPNAVQLIGGPPSLAAALRERSIEVSYSQTLDDLPVPPSVGPDLTIILNAPDPTSAPQAWLESLLLWAGSVASSSARIHIVSVTALDPSGEASPLSHSVRALLQSLMLENPGVTASVLAVKAPTLDAIIEELRQTPMTASCPLIRRLDGVRQGLVVSPSLKPPSAPLKSIRSHGHYLLVGGLGEVGIPLAKGLIERHHAQISVIGRRAMSQSIAERLERIGSPDQVRYFACDAGQPEALSETLAHITAAHPRIDGVFHLARHVTPEPIHRLQRGEITQTLSPKVNGSEVLIQALNRYRPDWVVLFSSLAAWAGQAGGAHYAAACAYQEGLAMTRPLPILSVAWPQWAHDRYLDSAKRQQWESRGLSVLEAEPGLQALEALLQHGSGAYGVLHGVDDAMATLLGQIPNFDASENMAWEVELEQLDATTCSAYRDYLFATLSLPKVSPGTEATPSIEAEQLTSQIMSICSEYLKISPDVLTTTSFEALGLDSIRALHLAERLQRQLQCPVEPVMLFEHPTIDKLSEALLSATQ